MESFHQTVSNGWFYAFSTVRNVLPSFTNHLLPCTNSEIKNWWKHANKLRTLKWYTFFGGLGFSFYQIYKLTWDLPKSIGFFIFVLSVYTAVTLVTSLAFAFPSAISEDDSVESLNSKTAVIIAAHRAESDIADVLDRLLIHFPAKNIYVADNSNEENPPDDTRYICETLNVNYEYYPVPCKTNALLRTGLSLPKNFEYIMCLDDDTLLPSSAFDIDSKLFTDNTVGITYLLRVRDAKNTLSRVIEHEFLLLSWRNFFKGRLSTMKFLPGIIAVWKRFAFEQIYTRNPCRYSPDKKYFPFGEDGWAGYIARDLGYSLNIDLRYCVYTTVPEKICCCGLHSQGYGSSTVWKQRGLRWYRNYLRRLPLEIKLLFTYCPTGRYFWRKKIIYFMEWFYGLFLIIGSMSIPLVFAQVLIGDIPLWVYLVVHGGMYCTGIINGIWTKYYTLRHRKELAPDLRTIFIYPLFTTWIAFARLWGGLGTIFYYTPCVEGNFKRPDNSVKVLPEEFL
jgi:hypothetical protein